MRVLGETWGGDPAAMAALLESAERGSDPELRVAALRWLTEHCANLSEVRELLYRCVSADGGFPFICGEEVFISAIARSHQVTNPLGWMRTRAGRTAPATTGRCCEPSRVDEDPRQEFVKTIQ